MIPPTARCDSDLTTRNEFPDVISTGESSGSCGSLSLGHTMPNECLLDERSFRTRWGAEREHLVQNLLDIGEDPIDLGTLSTQQLHALYAKIMAVPKTTAQGEP